MRYKRKLDLSIDSNSYQTIKLSEPSNINAKTMYVDSFSMGCSTYIVTSFDCGFSGNHTNGQYCSVLGVSMELNTIVVTFDPNCMSGGGGGGGGYNNPTPPIITIPTSAPIYTTHDAKGKTCNSLGLNSSEIDQINSDQSLRLKIYQYIVVSASVYPLPCNNDYFVEEYKTFIKSVIKYVS